MQKCPVCLTGVEFSARYPKYVCVSCKSKAADENKRPLTFYNESLSGGFIAIYTATGEKRESHICYIDGIKCFAKEARFGGIVIQIYDEKH